MVQFLLSFRKIGKPYIGVVEASYNGRKGLYAFRKSEPGEKVPGKMVFNRWASMKTSKGDKWLFFGSNGLNQKKGAGVYKLLALPRIQNI